MGKSKSRARAKGGNKSAEGARHRSAPPSGLGPESPQRANEAVPPSVSGTVSGAPKGRESLVKGAVIAEKYQIVDQVGAGSFGQVYQAFRVDLPDHLLAIKILPLDANSSELIQHELTALAAVAHPNIVQLSDHGVEAAFAWYTMPWYDSITLQQQLNRRSGKPLTLEEAHRIFLPVADALVALHEAGFRHQDVKPDNILLAQFGGATERHPLIIDLGLATQHKSQLLGGTPEFMSPEQAQSLRGESALVEERSDVYSLAATLLYTLMDEETRSQVFAKALAEAEPQQVLEGVLERTAQLATPRKSWFSSQPLVARGALRRTFKEWLSLSPGVRPNAKQFARGLTLLGLPKRVYRRARRWLLIVSCFLALLVPTLWVTSSFLDDMSALKLRTDQLLGSSAKLAGQQRILETQKAELTQEIAALESAKRQLDVELQGLTAQAEKEKQAAKRRLNGARMGIRMMRDELAQLERDKLLLVERRIRAQDVAKELKQELSTQREEHLRVSNQLSALNGTLKEANSKAKLHQAELNAAQSENAGLRLRLRRLEVQIRGTGETP